LHDRRSELAIARKLDSDDPSERDEAVGTFVRLFTFSAPAQLALLALRQPEVVRAYRGDTSLVQHLLAQLTIPPEQRLAWRLALLKGPALLTAVDTFCGNYQEEIRRQLTRVTADADDVWQELFLKLSTQRQFRQSVFGSYAGLGRLVSFLRRAFLREAIRCTRRTRNVAVPSESLEERTQCTERGPDRGLDGEELSDALAEVLRELTDDPGLLPFILQCGLGLKPAQVARVLRLSPNTVRQRTFRFRRRFKALWSKRFAEEAFPFADPCPPTDDRSRS